MHAGASRIALSNPRLHTFTIAFLPANVPVSRDLPRPEPLSHGSYELLTDAYGIPMSLLACERTNSSSPASKFISIGSTKGKVRRTRYELRPPGHPDVEKKGWGMLFVERSTAGQEARLIGFCVWVLVLAGWGVLEAVGCKFGSGWVREMVKVFR